MERGALLTGLECNAALRWRAWLLGLALGNPVAGLAVGQAVGGLVEQGGQELFHFESTDRLARSIAREQAHRRSREPQNFFPTATQLRNAADVSREISTGVLEGLASAERSRNSGDVSRQASFPEEISATIQIQFPDGSLTELTDQIVRLRDQDRVNI